MTAEQRAALDRAKRPPHPWRAHHPLSPPRDTEKVIPFHARQGVRA